MAKLLFLFSCFLILLIIIITSFVLIIKYARLSVKYSKLLKYLYNYLNTITSARYGNLNSRIDDGICALTIQLSKNTNALLESISDRDKMIGEYIEREKQAQNIKQDFISSLAHDLKVPVIAADNTYDLFLNGSFGEISQEQEKAIKNLKISNNDLKNLIIDLLDAQKIDTQELSVNYSIIKPEDVILEVIEQTKSILTIRNKEIIFNAQNKDLTIEADIFLIKRMLINLISNAIFYGKNSKNIYINLEKIENFAKISVIDEGDGIKEEEINNIFKKYYSCAKKYSNIGIGLGLYIVNKIVLAHKGRLEASNYPSKGACIGVYIPIEQPKKSKK